MKKFIAFACIILGFTILSIFVAEKTDVMGLSKIRLSTSFVTEPAGRLQLRWERLPYPCFYKVEAFSKTTDLLKEAPEYHLMASAFTIDSSYDVPGTAIPMYYRVTSYGMFGRIHGPTGYIANPNFPDPARPVPIYRYTAKNPASLMPFLVWHSVPTAVCYEVELLSGLPDAEGGTALSKKNHLYSTRLVFTNGWQADLRPYYRKQNAIYWRVRALGLHHEPIGVFSDAELIHIDAALPMPDAPLVNNFDRMPDFQQPLYPVFEWIPLNGVDRYEVELMVHPPKAENNAQPTEDRAWHQTVTNASACYDEYPRPYAGKYYWRVRGVDGNGKTIGSYSDSEEFIVKEHKDRILAAVFGDSITHGGGAVSYSPASLEYSYNTYLDFPAVNLGRSGDTSRTSLERLEQDVLPFHPKNLLILTGTNSLRTTEISAEDVIADIRAMRDICNRNDIRPIFLTLMPINPQNIAFVFQAETDPQWHQKMEKINGYIRQQSYFIDLESYFYDRTHTVMDYSFSVDGLHPDIRGKMLMGEVVNLHKDLLRE